MKSISYLLCAFCALCGSISTAAKPQLDGTSNASPARTSPNVVFILTDDLGYADIGCYGAAKVETPHIDRLATEGIRFTDFHTAASICSPSRAAFLTGAWPQRCGLYMGINPNREAHWFLGLHPDEITVAEQFKSAGYGTSMIGKWHLGTESMFSPLRQGFDNYYGMPCNFSHSPKFFDGEKEIFAKTPLTKLTELYTDRLTKTVRDMGDTPFFIYYAHNYPHTPFKPGARFAGSSRDGDRGDIIQELDWSVGELMNALDETGVSDNTVVIFTSDNGPTKNTYALPYRGTKYVTFEGGHRVPFIIRWPAAIAPGQILDEKVHAMDLFPTLSEIVGAPLPPDRTFDGVSLLPLFGGDPIARADSAPFYYYNCENLQAVRRGDWKLHLPRTKEQLPFWDKNKAFTGLEAPVLYNLAKDPAESRDVAAAHPELVRQLEALAAEARAELGEYSEGGFGPRGRGQRPTGSRFPEAPVVSHSKDWPRVDKSLRTTIANEKAAATPGRKKNRR